VSETWYRIAFDDGDGVRLAVAPGDHLGAAIGVAAARLGRSRPVWPVAAAQAAAGEVPLGESVGKGVVVERIAPEALDVSRRFHFPSGVVAALGAGPRLALASGLAERTGQDALVLEAVAEGEGARERFLEVIERLPVVDNIEVQVADHYDHTQTDVWLTPRLKDPRRALRFLDDFSVDLLDSGHVDVAAYVREPRSTWRLTQHKTLVWMTVDEGLYAKVRAWLERAGLQVRDDLPTIAASPHHHYRPASSSLRARLETRLGKAGLRKVDTLPPPQ
jgi:hypothetical protein